MAGTLHTRSATASAVSVRCSETASPLPWPIGEIGRATRTMTMLRWITDETFRRRILVQLNRQESRHALARALFHGRRGQLYQAYRTGQESQLGALGLVVKIVCLFNSTYIDRAVSELADRGRLLADEDLARISLLARGHIQLQGRYVFSLPREVERGELRPLPRRS